MPARGEALVRMLAAGVSFGEQSMRRGLYPGQPKFPFVMGYDIVGTVTAVGADDIDPAGVETALLNGITATQMLFRRLTGSPARQSSSTGRTAASRASLSSSPDAAVSA